MSKTLWAPWRMEYILSEKTGECILCLDKKRTKDKNRLVLYRGAYSFALLNRYPYNNGHLMVAPLAHIANIEDLTSEASLEMFTLLQESIKILRTCLKADGFNVGINIGSVGGAGVEDHLHIHVVPRWNGDTNFMAVFNDVRIMPEYLEDSYSKLYPYFNNLKI